jgi:hypothetical protein
VFACESNVVLKAHAFGEAGLQKTFRVGGAAL